MPTPPKLNIGAATPPTVTIEQVRANVESLKSSAKKNAAGTDQKLFDTLVEDAVYCRIAGKTEAALSRCYEALACSELNRRAMGGEQKRVHAYALSNLASALHALGHLATAKQLYVQAHQELASAPRAFLECCCFDVRELQMDYIASRAELATEGKIPDPRSYLDVDGTEKLWSDSEVADAQPRALEVEADVRANPPALNMGSLGGVSHRSYPITTTPRNALW